MDGDKQPQGAPEQEPGWVFKPGTAVAPPAPTREPARTPPKTPDTTSYDDEDSIEWTASEFIAHQKNIKWYVALIIFAVVVAAIVYLLTKDEISTVAVLVAAVLFGVAAGHKPRVLAYRVDESGITIGQKSYPYESFKSFTIVDEGAFSSIMLLPIKRFTPAYTIYYAPDDEEEIMTVLTHYLPFEQRKDGIFDSIVHRIRF